MERPRHFIRWFFDSRSGPSNRLIPRWIFLRALSAIYFSAFFSLIFQIKGLIGPHGVLPAWQYLAAIYSSLGTASYWIAPSLFWLSAGSPMLMAVTWVGLLASLLALANVWPRLNFFICFICFLSFVSAAGEFSAYQSDGMLLEAGFLALFFAPTGMLPGWGAEHLPARASLLLLQWEWFRIYFESGMVKMLSGDRQWRNFTAMDEYYQNSPLPTWIGWYVAHLPHWFQMASAGGTLLLEFGVVLMLFFPRRVRLICFLIVTPWEIGVILTGNYAFLNYLVLSLGFLLLDDDTLRRFVPARFAPARIVPARFQPAAHSEAASSEAARSGEGTSGEGTSEAGHAVVPAESPSSGPEAEAGIAALVRNFRVAIAAVLLSWIAYATMAELVSMIPRRMLLPAAPVNALEPFRIANQYGLFAVMTRGRYEIEFQGSNDAEHWTAYSFRYKPQAVNEAPGIYAPYQPRFDWNLWFASLGDWRQNQMVPIAQEHLLENDADVLGLFRGNPFQQSPPRYVRAVLWQYWFTSVQEKRQTGNWWRRQLLGLYSPVITRTPDGRFSAVQLPDELPPHD